MFLARHRSWRLTPFATVRPGNASPGCNSRGHRAKPRNAGTHPTVLGTLRPGLPSRRTTGTTFVYTKLRTRLQQARAQIAHFSTVRGQPSQLHPEVAPQVSHLQQAPLRTSVNWPHSTHGSPS